MFFKKHKPSPSHQSYGSSARESLSTLSGIIKLTPEQQEEMRGMSPDEKKAFMRKEQAKIRAERVSA